MLKNKLMFILLHLLFLNNSYAAPPSQSIIGEWKMIHEYGEKKPSFEIMSFFGDNSFSISNGTCGKYSISEEKIKLTISKLTREFTIPFQWKMDKENLKFGKDITQANTYALTGKKPKPCSVTSDWEPFKDKDFSFLLPKNWIYKIEKQADGKHYRLMISNTTAEKSIIIMATQLLNSKPNSAQVIDDLLLDYTQKINNQLPLPIDYKLDTNNRFPQYQINQGKVYYGKSAISEHFMSGDKVGDWIFVIIISQHSDQLLEIPKILKSLHFEGNTLTD